jgi:hypothetical protein
MLGVGLLAVVLRRPHNRRTREIEVGNSRHERRWERPRWRFQWPFGRVSQKTDKAKSRRRITVTHLAITGGVVLIGLGVLWFVIGNQREPPDQRPATLMAKDVLEWVKPFRGDAIPVAFDQDEVVLGTEPTWNESGFGLTVQEEFFPPSHPPDRRGYRSTLAKVQVDCGNRISRLISLERYRRHHASGLVEEVMPRDGAKHHLDKNIALDEEFLRLCTSFRSNANTG